MKIDMKTVLIVLNLESSNYFGYVVRKIHELLTDKNIIQSL